MNHIKKCKECGHSETLRYSSKIVKDLMDRNLCFICGFWDDKLKLLKNPNTAIIENNFYIIGEEKYKYPGEMRGYAGCKFTIQFKDDRKVTTTNLWCCGAIPLHFRERIKDNAVFID